MRDTWYADNRDLVKWSVLLLLAREHTADRVIHIMSYRQSNFGQILLDSTSYAMPSEVIAHFRDCQSITRLSTNPRISVFSELVQNREEYLASAEKFIEQFRPERCILFLDPDTGLAPSGRTGLEHVTSAEVRAFWNMSSPEWILALYQHQTNRAGKPWIDEKRRQFATAIGLAQNAVLLASSEIARDVVFFYAIRSGSEN
jgi:hypothetical protein